MSAELVELEEVKAKLAKVGITVCSKCALLSCSPHSRRRRRRPPATATATRLDLMIAPTPRRPWPRARSSMRSTSR